MKKVCSAFLILLYLVSAISSRDDRIRLAAILHSATPGDATFLASSQVSDDNSEVLLATLLDQLEDARLSQPFTLDPGTTSYRACANAIAESYDCYVSVPNDRAPPRPFSA